jgi:DNA-binding IclR family transcriptional regulator
MPPVPDRPSTQRQNRSVSKAAALLRAAGRNADGETVSGLARAAGLPRATALRMIEALVDERLLSRLGDDRIVVGAGLHAIARATSMDEVILDAARGPLEALTTRTGETITLTVAHADGSVEIIRQLDGPYMLGLANWVGRPFALHASSSGKLALAFADPTGGTRSGLVLERLAARTITDAAALDRELATIRVQGWAEIEDELEDGLAAVSVGFSLDGVLIGSVNVSGPTTRLGAAARRALVPALRQACAGIESRLGRR